MNNRKSIRLKDYDYSQNGYYFITICTKNRELLFGDIRKDKMILNKAGNIVQSYLIEMPRHYQDIKIDEFVIMPNHIHVIINIDVGAIHELPLRGHELQRRKMLIPLIIGRFKMQSANQINLIRNKSGLPVWQRNYYDHIIRDDDDLNRIREYIINNPLKWAMDENNTQVILKDNILIYNKILNLN